MSEPGVLALISECDTLTCGEWGPVEHLDFWKRNYVDQTRDGQYWRPTGTKSVVTEVQHSDPSGL